MTTGPHERRVGVDGSGPSEAGPPPVGRARRPPARGWGAVGLIAVGVGGILAALTGVVAELTGSGSWALAGSVAVTGWAFSAVAALSCQVARSAERAGLVEVVAAAGVSRSRVFAAQAAAALVRGTVLLCLSGAVLAAVTATRLTADHAVERCLVFTVSQAPGVVCAVGIAMALVGAAPRRAAWVWAPVAWSAFARFFGGLVDLPAWARDLSVLGHHLDVVGPRAWAPLAIQMAVGASGVLVGLAAYRRRDLGA